MGSSGRNLLCGASRADRRDIARLLVEHAPAVLEQLEGRIPPRWQAVLSAEDVLQQTCTDAFLHFEQFVPETESSFAAWLSKIAQRNLLNAVRMFETDKRGGNRQRIEPYTAEDSSFALYEQLMAQGGTPSRNVARDEAQAALKRAIQQLPEDYRRVVQLFDLEACPVKEVARQLNRSPGAVYMIRARAHRYLGELLGSASKYFSRG